jgi:hypothetical protein
MHQSLFYFVKGFGYNETSTFRAIFVLDNIDKISEHVIRLVNMIADTTTGQIQKTLSDYTPTPHKTTEDIRDVISVGKLIRKNDGPKEEIEQMIRTMKKYEGN